MSQTHPTTEEIAGAIAEVRHEMTARGRSTVGAILKMSAAAGYAEPAEQLLNMALENLQDHLERILLRTFPGVTREQVAAAQQALGL